MAGLAFLSLAMRPFTMAPTELTVREGFLTVTLSWVSLALFGSFPFIFSGAIPSITDAFFETMSGFTTTGSSILTNIEIIPKSLLVWRNMTQWLGGMGVIALAVAVFPFLGVGGAQLFKAEIPGPTKDKISPRISETAKILWWVYLIFTAAETVLLMFGGLNFFDSLCVTFGTMATGGFAPVNASIAEYRSAYVDYITIFFMLVAGTNFNLHFWALRGKPVYYIRNSEFRFFYCVILASVILIMAARLVGGMGFSEELFRGSLFQVVSIVTTTGFVTENYELWPFFTQFVLLLLMFIGGCASSTGGAIKNVRIYVLFKYIGCELKKLFHPRGVFPIKMENKVVPENIVLNIMGFIALYSIIFVFGVLTMTFLGLNLDTAIGSVAATLGNVGPGLGSVGPIENYAHIPVVGKWVLSFLMMAGRLEIYTVLVIFTPHFWR
jgi:trk system potassium uptake protein TrkH